MATVMDSVQRSDLLAEKCKEVSDRESQVLRRRLEPLASITCTSYPSLNEIGILPAEGTYRNILAKATKRECSEDCLVFG